MLGGEKEDGRRERKGSRVIGVRIKEMNCTIMNWIW